MISKNRNLSAILAAVALGSSNLTPLISRNEMLSRAPGPSGSPKRNQERSIKRMSQCSRVINRD